MSQCNFKDHIIMKCKMKDTSMDNKRDILLNLFKFEPKIQFYFTQMPIQNSTHTKRSIYIKGHFNKFWCGKTLRKCSEFLKTLSQCDLNLYKGLGNKFWIKRHLDYILIASYQISQLYRFGWRNRDESINPQWFLN